MGKPTCSIDGCDKSVHSRGWCPMHYQRWRQNGSPLIQFQAAPRRKRPVRVGVDPCSIDGCSQVIKARDLCARHYSLWRRHGDPLFRIRGEVVDGKRVCPTCRIDKPLNQYGPRGSCRSCCALARHEWRKANPDRLPKTPTSPRLCDNCGGVFDANKRRNRYCSPPCFEAFKNKANWKHVQKRRARMKDALVEVFDSAEIYERDGWICALCSEPMDASLRAPNPLAPSIDHIVPIARGGKHERANVQPAHIVCNSRKGVRIPTP